MSNLKEFTQAYLTAMDFTELGETSQGQPPSTAQLTKLSKAQAWSACRNFYEACRGDIGDHVEQAGHDFWFTRQGHGVGFWDRPEIYGKEVADLLTKVCKAVGEVHDVDYGDRSFGGLRKGTRFLDIEGEEYVKGETPRGKFKVNTTVWILED